MEEDRVQAEAGWGYSGLNDARSISVSMQDPKLATSVAPQGMMAGMNFPASPAAQFPSSQSAMVGPLGGRSISSGDLYYPQIDSRHSSPESSQPSDAQLNLKRRITQLVQMRAMQHHTLFGLTSRQGEGAAAEQPPLFRAQSLPQLPGGDNSEVKMGLDGMDEQGIWKSQSQKFLGTPSNLQSMTNRLMSSSPQNLLANMGMSPSPSPHNKMISSSSLPSSPSPVGNTMLRSPSPCPISLANMMMGTSPRNQSLMPSSPSASSLGSSSPNSAGRPLSRPPSRPSSRPPSRPEGQEVIQNQLVLNHAESQIAKGQQFDNQQSAALHNPFSPNPFNAHNQHLPQQQQQQHHHNNSQSSSVQMLQQQQQQQQQSASPVQHLNSLSSPAHVDHYQRQAVNQLLDLAQQHQNLQNQQHFNQNQSSHVQHQAQQQQAQQQLHHVQQHQAHQQHQQQHQTQSNPGQQHQAQPNPGQQHRAQPNPGQQHQTQPHPGQHQPQPHLGQQHQPQLHPGQQHQTQPYPGQHHQARPHPGQQRQQHQMNLHHGQQQQQQLQQKLEHPLTHPLQKADQQLQQQNHQHMLPQKLQEQMLKDQQMMAQHQFLLKQLSGEQCVLNGSKSSMEMPPPPAPPPIRPSTQGSQGYNIQTSKPVHTSMNTCVSTTASSSTVMSFGALGISTNRTLESSGPNKHAAQVPPLPPHYQGLQNNIHHGSFEHLNGIRKNGPGFPEPPVSSKPVDKKPRHDKMDFEKTEGSFDLSVGNHVLPNANKPKKVVKKKSKVEKPTDSSKISDMMSSDIDRKLLAMFPQYQFYLDQNTKPVEGLMPLPGKKAPKKKRAANAVTVDGEPKKKKKVKKKTEEGQVNPVVPVHSDVPNSALLASEAAPMDTELKVKMEEEKTVARILAAIRDPKDFPSPGNGSLHPPVISSANDPISRVNVPPKYESAEIKQNEDPFRFSDDEMDNDVKPVLSKKTAFDSKSNENKNTFHDKFCCNHCEVTGVVGSVHCENKNNLQKHSLPDTSQAGAGSVPQSINPGSEVVTGLSESKSPVSFTVSSSHQTTLPTPPEEIKPRDYIQNHEVPNQINPLANLQASIFSMFDQSDEKHGLNPKYQLPPDVLNEYLNKLEAVAVNKQHGTAPNGVLPSKNAEFLATNYTLPHEIKPVPPSTPSALNHSGIKMEVKTPEISPEGPEGCLTPQTTPTKDKTRGSFPGDDDFMPEDLSVKLGPTQEELFERLKNNKVEVAHCNCLGPNTVPNENVEGPFYSQLGVGRDVASIRKVMEERTGASGKAIRIEKILYTGKEGKSTQGCPIAKWIIRRSGPEEKFLCICRHRQGHFCEQAYIICNIVAWEGVPSDMANDLYSYIRTNVTKHGFETERRCGTNERKTCGCQGLDLVRRGASFSFGCSWSMYFNGCKYARSRDARKFKLKDTEKETELEGKLQNLASLVGPLYETVAPDAHRNQCQFQAEGYECRIGQGEKRPFSGVTACVDFCAHAHKDFHNMNNGSTVVVTLTKNRGFEKPDDEQLHVLPLYVVEGTDEYGSVEGQRDKIRNGSLEALANFPIEAKIRAQPLTPKKRVKGGKKESPNAKKKKEQEAINPLLQEGNKPALNMDHKAMLEQVMKQESTESLSFEDLMSHAYLPDFNELYSKFWDYFYANGTFPSGGFLAKWAANKMSFMKNSGKSEPNQNHPQGQHGSNVPGNNWNSNNLHHPPRFNTPQEKSPASFSSPLDMLSAAAALSAESQAAMKQECSGQPNGPSLSQSVPFQPGQAVGSIGGSPHSTPTAQDLSQRSEHPSMQHQRASSLPQDFMSHSSYSCQSDINHPFGNSNRANCNPAENFMCNGNRDNSVLNCDKREHKEGDEPREQILDPTIVKCEWELNEEMFRDSDIGGVAIALGHGAVLFEVAKRELHATTSLKNPNRYQPTRISLVFYQHKNMNYRHHGWYENERKMESLRQKRLEKMKEDPESENRVNGATKGVKKKKSKTIDFSKTSAAQYKYMWQAPVRHGISLTTDSIITRWIDPQPMVSGPYQRWV